jgi:hypothetical protein
MTTNPISSKNQLVFVQNKLSLGQLLFIIVVFRFGFLGFWFPFLFKIHNILRIMEVGYYGLFGGGY